MLKTESLWRADVQQRVFRELLEAFARPGGVRDLADLTQGADAARGVLATLMDGETTLADPHGLIDARDWPLLQAQRAAPEEARHVVVDGRRAPDFQPALGTLESPEFGATILIEIDRLGQGETALELTGPGSAGQRQLRLAGLHPDWLARRAEWVGCFPLGVDLLLADTQRIVALPRTTRIHVSGGVR